jgi:hypothetical protein
MPGSEAGDLLLRNQETAASRWQPALIFPALAPCPADWRQPEPARNVAGIVTAAPSGARGGPTGPHLHHYRVAALRGSSAGFTYVMANCPTLRTSITVFPSIRTQCRWPARTVVRAPGRIGVSLLSS